MGNPEPITIGIKTDYDGKGLDKSVTDTRKLSDETDKSGKSAEKSSASNKKQEASLTSLNTELRQLIEAESRHQSSLEKGTKETKEDSQASAKRKQRIDQLARSIAKQEDEQTRLTAQTKRAVSANRQYDESGRSLGGTFGSLRGIMQNLKSAIGGFVGGLIGTAGLVAAMRLVEQQTQATNEMLQKQIELAQQATRATLDLHALSLKFSPEDEEALGRFQEISGRGRAELAPAFTAFKSATGSLTPQEQRERFEELVVLPSLGTGGSIDSQAKLAARLTTTIEDPVALRNLQILAIKAAGEGDPAVFNQALANLIPVGAAADISPADTTALLSVVSRSINSPESATGLKAILNRSGTDKNAIEVYQKLGFGPDDSLFEKLAAVKQADLPKEELVKLSGGDQIGILKVLLQRQGEIEQVRKELGVFDDGGDIYGDFLEDLFSKSPNAKHFTIASQQDQKTIVRAENDPKLGRIKSARKALADIFDTLVRKGRIEQNSVNNRLERFDELVAFGHDPVDAIEFIEGPNRLVPGPGIIGGTEFTLGTSSFQGIREEVARRLGRGVQGPGGRFFDSVPGADKLPPVPITRPYPYADSYLSLEGRVLGPEEAAAYNAQLNRTFDISQGGDNPNFPQQSGGGVIAIPQDQVDQIVSEIRSIGEQLNESQTSGGGTIVQHQTVINGIINEYGNARDPILGDLNDQDPE